MGCRRRTFKYCAKLDRRMVPRFKGGTKGREREGSQWLGEEQAWENRGIRGQKGPVIRKQVAGLCTYLAVPSV